MYFKFLEILTKKQQRTLNCWIEMSFNGSTWTMKIPIADANLLRIEA